LIQSFDKVVTGLHRSEVVLLIQSSKTTVRARLSFTYWECSKALTM